MGETVTFDKKKLSCRMADVMCCLEGIYSLAFVAESVLREQNTDIDMPVAEMMSIIVEKTEAIQEELKEIDPHEERRSANKRSSEKNVETEQQAATEAN